MKFIKKLIFNLIGGKVIDIDKDTEIYDDELPSVINPKIIKPLSKPKIVIHHSTSGNTYANGYNNWSSIEDELDYKEYRRQQLKKELMDDRELLNDILTDLRKDKIEKIKNNKKYGY